MRLWPKKKKKPEQVEVPAEWKESDASTTPAVENTMQEKINIVPVGKTPRIPVGRPKKIHVPILRPIKRGIATVLCILNALFGITALAMENMLLPLFFFSTTFILLDYIWKTARKPLEKELEWEKKEKNKT